MRSQDKEDLIKVDNLGLAYEGKYAFVDNDRIDYKFYICQFTNNFHAKLGVYATKERALEVLDEIQNILKPKYILDSSSIKPNGDSWVENGIVMQKYNADARIEKILTYVYEMPEE